ncbi:CHASE2 domain-containing protein [Variovorax arabinosiphilus]|uniref:CHASE2 domain-containing protein n=1 Tax=Variovorax arabinosiphilus TaxID=3053498 RepID=UPI0025783746|nr:MULTISPECIES: CHASE2 domain-containing protein [unclassified Variovorax]MDM0119347.1 CHASE2 domain-containing protein [Variovorax sp. J2L1-78]MDM0129773.1 CHASE2 domain-containing protein [Variovorax sp. J2L1-63]MDM0232441.1 CHASE2 domain-containing protein [Variovorax sp. J2R1-6]
MTAPTGTLWKRRSWQWDAWVAIVTVITGLFLAWLTQQMPEEEILKRAVMRSVAPALTPAYSDGAKGMITILTIDDLDLKTFGEKWPLKYDFLARRLDAVLQKKPKAIFIDLLLRRDAAPSEIQALQEVICKRRGDTTIYIASVNDGSLDSAIELQLFRRSERPPFEPCAKKVNAQISWDKYDQSQWEYPTAIKSEGTRPAGLRSAAFDIFCDEWKHRCPADASEPMALIWPTRSFPTNLESMIRIRRGTEGNADPTYEPACRNGIPLWEALPGSGLMKSLLDGKKDEARLAPCPFLRVFPLRSFNRRGFSDAEVTDAIANKIVFLGADIVGAADKIVSPVNGVLPGVHAHAMALDNLITFDGRYKQSGEFKADDPLSPGSLFVIISVIAIVVILTVWKHYFTEAELPQSITLGKWQSRMGKATLFLLAIPLIVLGAPRSGANSYRRERLLGKLGFFSVNIALVALIFCLGYRWLDQGPLSMLEYVLFPFLAHFLHLGETIAVRGCDWFHSLAKNNPWEEWARRRAKHGSDDIECAATTHRT